MDPFLGDGMFYRLRASGEQAQYFSNNKADGFTAG